MNKHQQKNNSRRSYFWIISGLILLIIAGIIFIICFTRSATLTESDAISLIKTSYPEFQNYPNTNLPPQSIRTEKQPGGWHVAFVQEGSGRPILGATCFFINRDRNIQMIGKFVPEMDDSTFSLKTCKK